MLPPRPSGALEGDPPGNRRRLPPAAHPTKLGGSRQAIVNHGFRGVDREREALPRYLAAGACAPSTAENRDIRQPSGVLRQIPMNRLPPDTSPLADFRTDSSQPHS